MSGGADLRGLADTRLHKYQLILARSIWGLFAGLSLVVFFASLPLYFSELQSICKGANCVQGQPTHATVQTLHALGLSISSYALGELAILICTAWVGFVVGGVIFWRKSDDWMALLVALFLVTFTAQNYSSPAALIALNSAWRVPVELVQFLSNISVAFFGFLFPNGRFVPRWTGLLTITWTVIEALSSFFPGSSLDISNYPLLDGLTFLSFLGFCLFAQIYRFRRVSSPSQRQQTKWVVFGLVIAGLGIAVLSLPYLVFPSQTVNGSLYDVLSTPLYNVVLLFISLFLGIAILRSRLWDIDILINRTLVYGTLTALLALVYFGLIVALQYLLHGVIGPNNDVAIVVSTLAISALFQPLRSRIQRVIDRRFYRQKYDAARTLEAFGATLQSEVDLTTLCYRLLAVVQETMQPAHVSLWLHSLGKDNEGREEALSSRRSPE